MDGDEAARGDSSLPPDSFHRSAISGGPLAASPFSAIVSRQSALLK